MLIFTPPLKIVLIVNKTEQEETYMYMINAISDLISKF